jgi:hypothetical protein
VRLDLIEEFTMPGTRPDPIKHRSARAALLVLGAAWLGGCGGGVTVKGEWQGGAQHGQAFKRVLIVGVSPNYTQRCAFEWALASQLKSDSTVAIVSCDSMTSKDPLTRENVERVVASTQADAVLTTRLLAMKLGAQEGGGGADTRGGGYYKATDYGWQSVYAGGYGVYDLPVVYGEFQTAPTITTLNGEVHVQSKLFETHAATLVYTMDTEAKSTNIESSSSGILGLAAPIADRLRREGLAR